jgi:hypothetical protein
MVREAKIRVVSGARNESIDITDFSTPPHSSRSNCLVPFQCALMRLRRSQEEREQI